MDIKLDNILITDDNFCKLADFGLVFDTVNTNQSKATEGDSRYLAPELLEGSFCLANDIFSLGITLLELSCNLELPANGSLWQQLRNGILPVHAMDKYQVSQELRQIISAMMDPDPAKRPSVDDLLRHPKLKHLRRQRRIGKILLKCKSMFMTIRNLIKVTFLTIIFWLYNFFKLRDNSQQQHQQQQQQHTHDTSRVYNNIAVPNIDENSDTEDVSFKTSANTSRVSKLSGDDDNNNENSITPTLNASIPRITPDHYFTNSTPLNHFSNSNRKYRKDLTRVWYEFFFNLIFNKIY